MANTPTEETIIALLHEIAGSLQWLIHASNAATPNEQVDAEARADAHRQEAARIRAGLEQQHGSA